jgi:predicted nucleic acid-binding Zn ribbon protein
MTGMKASPMRRICKVCRSGFRPNRTDAEFCSNQCQQSAYRARKKTSSIELPGQKEKDAKPHADFYDYRGYAAYLRSLARRYDARVRFMGTLKGILAAEETPGALAASSSRVLGGGGSLPWELARDEASLNRPGGG